VLTARPELHEYSPGAAYRVVELLLGRISSLSQTGDFTTQTGNFTGMTPLLKREGYENMNI
jgi:carboxypeptidase D